MNNGGFLKERREKFLNNHSILFGEPDEQEVAFHAEQEAIREARIAARKSQKLATKDAEILRVKVSRSQKYLQKYGHIVNAEYINKNTINKFENAVRNGKAKIVGNLLKKFRYLPQLQTQLLASDKDGCGSLHRAAGRNHSGVVRKILHAAKGDREQLERLLAPTVIGTPWQLAVKGNCDSVISEFLDFVEGNKEFTTVLFESRKPRGFLDDPANPLTMLIIKGKVEYVRRILNFAKENKELSELLFSPDSMGNTSLHTAAAWGHVDIIKVLVEAGMDTHAKNGEGHTALFLINRKHAENGNFHSHYENRLREAEAAVVKNREELERFNQQLRSTSGAISFLEQAMVSTAMPAEVDGSKVDASQVKLGQHPEVLFSLARCQTLELTT